MADAGYLLSASYVAALSKTLTQLQLLDSLPKPSPALQEMLSNPFSKSWWEPTPLEEMAAELVRHHSEAKLEQLGHDMVIPVVVPYLRVTLPMLGSNPTKLLERIGEITSASIRRVAVSFEPESPARGVVKVTYPSPSPPRSNGLLWLGALRRLLEVSRHPKLRIESMEQRGAAFVYAVAWD